jgi:alkylation response protein AidB-like acyl-CoA dehydrogenase
MDIRLSHRQRDVRDHLADLLTPEVIGTLRRLGERPLGAGSEAALDPAEAAARSSVWLALCELGLAALAVDPAGGRHAELVVAAELLGHALYPSPLADLVAVAHLVHATGGDHLGLLPALGAGRQTIALAARDSAAPDPSTMEILPDGGRVRAHRRFVAFAADVDLLLVAGRHPDGLGLAVVARDQPGVSVRRQDDVGRGDLYAVTLRDASVRGWLGDAPQWPGAPDAWAGALARARLIQAAYLAGLARGAVELTVAYVKSRQQFGQPIARFQAPAFRLAALHARTAAVGDLVQLGAWEADAGESFSTLARETSQTFGPTAMRALLLGGELARDAATEAIQLHGAHGMTERCDAQRFYRRAAVDAVWLGTPGVLRAELAGELATIAPAG